MKRDQVKTKLIRIWDRPSFSWKERLGFFITIFGILWLFFEPLAAFGFGIDIFSFLSYWGYPLLILGAIFITLLKELFRARSLAGNISWIYIIVIFTDSGVQFHIETPKELLIEKFLELFLDFVSSQKSVSNILSMRHMYNPSLLVRRGKIYNQLPNHISLDEAGIMKGDVCIIKAEIKDKFKTQLYNPG